MRTARSRRARGQAIVEVVVVTLVVGLAIAWVSWALPRAISSHYSENQKVLASPL